MVRNIIDASLVGVRYDGMAFSWSCWRQFDDLEVDGERWVSG